MIAFLATHVPRLLGGFYPDLLWRMPTEDRCAYLTFDDGPTARTGRLLDLLERYEAQATFFLIGAHAQRDPGLVRATAAAGHTIGNHTFTHPDAWRTPVPALLSELDRTTALLEDLVQRPIRWMRPPYGRFTRAMRFWCQARRQRLTMWDVMPGDYLPQASETQIRRRILGGLRPGSIVVLHDNPKSYPITPDALEALLPALRDEGWRFPAL